MTGPEAALGPPVRGWLEEWQADVYAEVCPASHGARADLAYRLSPSSSIVGVVELKTSLSLSLLEQAHGWVRWNLAHYVWIATPTSPGGFAQDVAERFGFGILQVHTKGNQAGRVSVIAEAPFHRKADPSALLRGMVPEAKGQTAGAQGGGYWTPFRGTCERVRRYVDTCGGRVEFGQVIKCVESHYSSSRSFRSSFGALLATNKIKGLRLDQAEGLLWVVSALPEVL